MIKSAVKIQKTQGQHGNFVRRRSDYERAHWIQNQVSGIVCESGKNYLCALLHIISRYVSPEDKKSKF